jgi:FkbM family methyltransferase
MNLEQFVRLASKQLGFKTSKGIYSQVDLQPAYGVIFEEYIKGFDFWGHCDIDIVWGDLRSFITEAILQNYDIVSCRKDFLAGHLTLWRNGPEINTIFTAVPSYRAILSSSEHFNFDESIISPYLKSLIARGSTRIRVYWPEQTVVSLYVSKANPPGWYWEGGKIFDRNHREHVYVHFGERKNSICQIDFGVGDQPERFRFTELGFESRRPSVRALLRANLGWDGLRAWISQFPGRSLRLLRQLKMVFTVKDMFWARKLVANYINARDVQFNQKTGGLSLKRLNLQISKEQDYLLESYYWALELAEKRNARFHRNERGELLVDVAGLCAFIETAEDNLILKELLVDGIYNVSFSRPAVVLDVGMNAGLASLYFASQPDVVVVGYEPCAKTYDRTLRNIALNPNLSPKIKPIKAEIGDANFRTTAMSLSREAARPNHLSDRTALGDGSAFEYEEIKVQDAAEVLNSIVADYPGREVVVKIDLERSGYFIDGISESHVITRLGASGKLELVETIMLQWHRSKPKHAPPVLARPLSDNGYKVFLLGPYHPSEGMLYAVRQDGSNVASPPCF